MQKKLVIAIDGLSSSGKSTLAKRLAETLDYRYIDSGAFYRAITQYLSEQGVNWNDKQELHRALGSIDIQFEYDLSNRTTATMLNNRNVESEIRGMKISNSVSEVAAIPEVRKFVVAKLQDYGKEGGIVMDGRDIGTVVFPDADLKIYMLADEKIRTERRFNEMKDKGFEVTESQITQNLSGRDHIDSTRMTAPLKRASDAVMLDSTHMTPKELFDEVLQLAKERIHIKY